MSYSRNPTWHNGSDGGTPINADRLENLENGLVNAASTADAAYPRQANGIPLSDLAPSVQAALTTTFQSAQKGNTNTFTSNTTTAADPELTLNVVANAVYEGTLRLHYTAAVTTGRVKVGFTYPNGNLDCVVRGVPKANTATDLTTVSPVMLPFRLSGGQSSPSAQFGVFGGAGSTECVLTVEFTLLSAAAGAITVVAAQSDSSSTATVLLPRSRMTLSRVA